MAKKGKKPISKPKKKGSSKKKSKSIITRLIIIIFVLIFAAFFVFKYTRSISSNDKKQAKKTEIVKKTDKKEVKKEKSDKKKEKSEKKKTVMFYTRQGNTRYLMFDKQGILYQTMTTHCKNRMSKDEFERNYPQVKF